jgi:hypothetical protein
MNMRFSTRLIPILFLASGIASAADVPIAQEKGPTGQATVAVGVGNHGPESISVRGETAGFSGGASVGTSGNMSASGGMNAGNASVNASVGHDVSTGNTSVGASVTIHTP